MAGEELKGFSIGLEPESLPLDEPGKRQVIMVVSVSDIERLRYSDNDKERWKEQEGVCLVPDLIEDFYEQRSLEFLKKLRKKGLLKPGNILFQSANNSSQYFTIDQIKKEVLEKKFNDYKTICNYLGATKIFIEISDEEQVSSKKSTKWRIRNPFASVKLDGKSFSEELSTSYSKSKLILDGNKPNIKAAEKYVETELLQKDPDIKFLIDNRKSALAEGLIKYPNILKRFEQKLYLFSKVEQSLELAVNLEIPQYLTKVNARQQNRLEHIKKFNLNVKVDFAAD